ncbi:MAG: hypothetical protein ACREQN_19160 [Candidatus Binataceae bacterium]
MAAVDTALNNYNNHTGNLDQLSGAWDAWKNSQRNWKTTDRYQKCLMNAVQQLNDDIGTQLRARQMGGPSQVQVASLLSPEELGRATATQFTRRADATASASILTVNITQTIHQWQWNVAGTRLEPQPASNLNYAWSTRLQFNELGRILTVTPIIRYKAKADATGTIPSKSELDNWKRTICGAWNNAVLVIAAGGGNPTKRLDIQFDIRWVTGWDSASAANSYKIQCTNLALPTPPPGAGWQTRKQFAEMTLDGSTMGTPNMEEWGVNDKQAVVHEFGHVLGNPDEYGVTVYNGNAVNGAIYDQPPFTTDSLMNDTRRAVIYPRHYETIRLLYAQWRGINLARLSVLRS